MAPCVLRMGTAPGRGQRPGKPSLSRPGVKEGVPSGETAKLSLRTVSYSLGVDCRDWSPKANVCDSPKQTNILTHKRTGAPSAESSLTLRLQAPAGKPRNGAQGAGDSLGLPQGPALLLRKAPRPTSALLLLVPRSPLCEVPSLENHRRRHPGSRICQDKWEEESGGLSTTGDPHSFPLPPSLPFACLTIGSLTPSNVLIIFLAVTSSHPSQAYYSWRAALRPENTELAPNGPARRAGGLQRAKSAHVP